MAVNNAVDLEILLGWVPQAEGFRSPSCTTRRATTTTTATSASIRCGSTSTRLDELRDETDVDDTAGCSARWCSSTPPGPPSAKALDASRSAPVHLRIVVDAHAPLRYHEIRWETLCSPDSGQRLTTSQNIRFSRYLRAGPGQPADACSPARTR